MTLARLIRENSSSRRYWQLGFGLLCFCVAATCGWLAQEHWTSPFDGPAAHFAPLERAASGSALILALGLASFALCCEGLGFLLGHLEGCYVALVVGAVPIIQFAFIIGRDPISALADGGWVILWVPAAAPAMAALGLYCESGFAANAKDIAALGHLKYDAHSA